MIEIIKIPKVGEGVQEVRIIRLFKQVGELVNKDEPLYEIETDKAVMEIESPCSGVIKEWLIKENDIVPVEKEAAYIGMAGDIVIASSEAQTHLTEERQTSAAVVDKTRIAPRVKAYCKQLHLTASEISNIPMAGNKLTIEDVDRYIAQRQHEAGAQDNFVVRPLSNTQKTLNYRFIQSKNSIIPSVITATLEWNKLKRLAQTLMSNQTNSFISEFQILAYLVAQTTKSFPKFRSILKDSNTLHEYSHINLGFAVETVNGELVTAVMDKADLLSQEQFFSWYEERLASALQGVDQAHGAVQLFLTYMGDNSGVEFALPVLVAPATAIIFISSPFMRDGKRVVNLVMNFNHQVINGMEATQFISQLKHNLTALPIVAANFQSIEITATNAIPETEVATAEFIQLTEQVVQEINRIIGANVDLQQSFGEQGIDSIKGVALIKNLSEQLKLKLSPILIWRYSTATKLIRHLASLLNIAVPREMQQDDSSNKFNQILRAVEDLDLEEVAELNKKLGGHHE